ncbi:hypothetical protein SNEBB_005012 [Seison nebaliae]|nr:hypothetical protein SNEBB_005012 [Seison nebaliae]
MYLIIYCLLIINVVSEITETNLNELSRINLNETWAVGTKIITLTGVTNINNDVVVFEVISDALELRNGNELFLSRNLDFENEFRIIAVITAKEFGGTDFETATLEINVLNDNDNKPIFVEDGSIYRLDPNLTDGGVIIPEIAVTDADQTNRIVGTTNCASDNSNLRVKTEALLGNTNLQWKYRLVLDGEIPADLKKIVQIVCETNDGFITTRHSYLLVTDGSTGSSIELNLSPNNLIPIGENLQINTILPLNVQTSGASGALTYSFLTEQEYNGLSVAERNEFQLSSNDFVLAQKYLSLNPSTGQIELKANLNADYNFVNGQLVASDLLANGNIIRIPMKVTDANGGTSAAKLVAFDVQNIDDEPKRFEGTTGAINIRLPETPSNGFSFIIPSIKFVSPEISPFESYQIKLTSPSTDVQIQQLLNSIKLSPDGVLDGNVNQFALTIENGANFDFESLRTIPLQLTAITPNGGQIETSTLINLDLQDKNDNPVQIDSPDIFLSLNNGDVNNGIITEFPISDLDSGINGIDGTICTLEGLPSKEKFFLRPISPDRWRIELKPNILLFDNTVSFHSYFIRCTDEQGRGFSTFKKFQISPSNFQVSSLSFVDAHPQLFEFFDINNNTNSIQTQCQNNQNLNGPIRYQLFPFDPNDSNLFLMEEETGKIIVRNNIQSISPDPIRFRVVCSMDLGTGQLISSEAILNLYVIDRTQLVDDNRCVTIDRLTALYPNINTIKTNETFYLIRQLSDNLPQNTKLFRIDVSTIDGNRSNIRFTSLQVIEPNDGSITGFRIDPITGVVSVGNEDQLFNFRNLNRIILKLIISNENCDKQLFLDISTTDFPNQNIICKSDNRTKDVLERYYLATSVESDDQIQNFQFTINSVVGHSANRIQSLPTNLFEIDGNVLKVNEMNIKSFPQIFLYDVTYSVRHRQNLNITETKCSVTFLNKSVNTAMAELPQFSHGIYYDYICEHSLIENGEFLGVQFRKPIAFLGNQECSEYLLIYKENATANGIISNGNLSSQIFIHEFSPLSGEFFLLRVPHLPRILHYKIQVTKCNNDYEYRLGNERITSDIVIFTQNSNSFSPLNSVNQYNSHLATIAKINVVKSPTVCDILTPNLDVFQRNISNFLNLNDKDVEDELICNIIQDPSSVLGHDDQNLQLAREYFYIDNDQRIKTRRLLMDLPLKLYSSVSNKFVFTLPIRCCDRSTNRNRSRLFMAPTLSCNSEQFCITNLLQIHVDNEGIETLNFQCDYPNCPQIASEFIQLDVNTPSKTVFKQVTCQRTLPNDITYSDVDYSLSTANADVLQNHFSISRKTGLLVVESSLLHSDILSRQDQIMLKIECRNSCGRKAFLNLIIDLTGHNIISSPLPQIYPTYNEYKRKECQYNIKENSTGQIFKIFISDLAAGNNVQYFFILPNGITRNNFSSNYQLLNYYEDFSIDRQSGMIELHKSYDTEKYLPLRSITTAKHIIIDLPIIAFINSIPSYYSPSSNVHVTLLPICITNEKDNPICFVKPSEFNDMGQNFDYHFTISQSQNKPGTTIGKLNFYQMDNLTEIYPTLTLSGDLNDRKYFVLHNDGTLLLRKLLPAQQDCFMFQAQILKNLDMMEKVEDCAKSIIHVCQVADAETPMVFENFSSCENSHLMLDNLPFGKSSCILRTKLENEHLFEDIVYSIEEVRTRNRQLNRNTFLIHRNFSSTEILPSNGACLKIGPSFSSFIQQFDEEEAKVVYVKIRAKQEKNFADKICKVHVTKDCSNRLQAILNQDIEQVKKQLPQLMEALSKTAGVIPSIASIEPLSIRKDFTSLVFSLVRGNRILSDDEAIEHANSNGLVHRLVKMCSKIRKFKMNDLDYDDKLIAATVLLGLLPLLALLTSCCLCLFLRNCLKRAKIREFLKTVKRDIVMQETSVFPIIPPTCQLPTETVCGGNQAYHRGRSPHKNAFYQYPQRHHSHHSMMSAPHYPMEQEPSTDPLTSANSLVGMTSTSTTELPMMYPDQSYNKSTEQLINGTSSNNYLSQNGYYNHNTNPTAIASMINGSDVPTISLMDFQQGNYDRPGVRSFSLNGR